MTEWKDEIFVPNFMPISMCNLDYFFGYLLANALRRVLGQAAHWYL